MKSILRFIKSIFFKNRFFGAGALLAILFVMGFYVPFLYYAGLFLLILFALLTLVDLFVLYRPKQPLEIRRIMTEKLSNGDENPVELYLTSRYAFRTDIDVIDEIPHQFQKRDVRFELTAEPGGTRVIQYKLRPVKRGEYGFGAVNAYVSSPLGLIARRIRIEAEKTVPVYPSFIQMRKYEFLAISNKLTMYGVKKIRI